MAWEIEQVADRVIEKDVLVIGTEAAGAVAAIAASERADVLMVTKSVMAKSGVTIMAVATYTAPLAEGDGPETTFGDTIVGGRFFNDQQLAKIFAEEAADSVACWRGSGFGGPRTATATCSSRCRATPRARLLHTSYRYDWAADHTRIGQREPAAQDPAA